MPASSTRVFAPIVLLVLIFHVPAYGQDKTENNKEHLKKSQVNKIAQPDGSTINQIVIELQNLPDSMEPVTEPRRIRIDDRGDVQFLLKNLSPFDVCTRSPGTPSVTAETPVGESLVGTIAKLGALAILDHAITPNAKVSSEAKGGNTEQLRMMATDLKPAQPPDCRVRRDPEYERLQALSNKLFEDASELIGTPPDGKCTPGVGDQVALGCKLDQLGTTLADYAAADYRGAKYTDFDPEGAKELTDVKFFYSQPLPSLQKAADVQAILDSMTTIQGNLHKKYDYTPVPLDVGPSTVPAPPSATADKPLGVSPQSLTLTTSSMSQIVAIASLAADAEFEVTTDSKWLSISEAGSGGAGGQELKGKTGKDGTFMLLVSVNDKAPTSGISYGSIIISLPKDKKKPLSSIPAIFKPLIQPSDCDRKDLQKVDDLIENAKTEVGVLNDNNKTLQGAQATLKTSYTALVKVKLDFKRRTQQNVIAIDGNVVVQKFNVSPDRKVTSPGNIACVSDLDGKTPTTININYSLLYQDIPHWTASAGFLVSFQQKKIIDIVDQTGSDPSSSTKVFQVTDTASAQFIPMAFVNYRLPWMTTSQYGKGKEDELVWTTHLSAGFGINPNSGTNQPEGFLGFAIGLNRLLFHPGVHFGRTEGLGGGFALNSAVPPNVTKAPIVFSYHPAFSIGFSVRLAPY